LQYWIFSELGGTSGLAANQSVPLAGLIAL